MKLLNHIAEIAVNINCSLSVKQTRSKDGEKEKTYIYLLYKYPTPFNTRLKFILENLSETDTFNKV